FFFQAEEGIRVFHVTGVQTCALPIYQDGRRRPPPATAPADRARSPQTRSPPPDPGAAVWPCRWCALPRLPARRELPDRPARQGQRADRGCRRGAPGTGPAPLVTLVLDVHPQLGDVEGDRHTHRSVRPHLVDLDGAVERDHQRLAVKAHLVGRDGLLAEAPRRLALAALDDLKDGLFHCADSSSFYDT